MVHCHLETRQLVTSIKDNLRMDLQVELEELYQLNMESMKDSLQTVFQLVLEVLLINIQIIMRELSLMIKVKKRF